MEDRLEFIEQFFDFEDLYDRIDSKLTDDLFEDYEFTDRITTHFFDHQSFYNTLKENTLKKFKERDELLNCLNKPVLKWGNELWDFITGLYGKDPDWYVSEESTLSISGDITYLSFTVDTGYSNEGGSHDGGYEYIFVIDLGDMIFRELQIVNWN
tara:strand:- start:1750 stop:2214 length:465 start_codon:yes stop_codon:yes gene_type:complete